MQPQEPIPPTSPEPAPQMQMPQPVVLQPESLPTVTENPSISAPTQVVSIPPQPFVTPQLPKKSHKKLILIILGIVLLVVAVALTAIFLFLIPAKNAKQFTKDSSSIFTELTDEVNELYDNNFTTALNVSTDYEASKKLLKVHNQDLQETKQAASDLKSKYDKLHPTSKNKAEKDKIDKAFVLSKSIITKYQSTLDFRQETFDAYNNLPVELQKYSEKYSKGGTTAEFYILAQNVSSSASSAYEILQGVYVEADDEELYDLRLNYLKDNKDTFTKLAQYYKTANVQLINSEVAAYSSRNVKSNEAIKAAIETYVKSSSIAKDFEAYKSL